MTFPTNVPHRSRRGMRLASRGSRASPRGIAALRQRRRRGRGRAGRRWVVVLAVRPSRVTATAQRGLRPASRALDRVRRDPAFVRSDLDAVSRRPVRVVVASGHRRNPTPSHRRLGDLRPGAGPRDPVRGKRAVGAVARGNAHMDAASGWGNSPFCAEMALGGLRLEAGSNDRLRGESCGGARR